MSEDNSKKEFDWFDRPASRKLLWRLLWGACLASVLAETPLHRHPVVKADWGLAFYAVIGFVGCGLVIYAAKLLGFLLKRPDDYYSAESAADRSEPLPEDIDEALR
ncbi:MAG: hypothetical protein KDM91_02395 [Verrucomicrobiae bacterium]|nr:hypothetical protein [Verrucomicrobiae bacterium]MCP5539209.1 hypothetical protein [Akkermansiaceae bacterium]MCP5549862.1 hypothetical protein [Akkermansiaceae bacterium]